MRQALGISAFVVLLLSVPIPLVGTYVTFLALVIATCAALAGEKVWTIVTTLVSFVKVFFLSPTWHLAMFGAAYMAGVNHAVSGAAQSLSQYGDAGTNQLVASSQAGMDQSLQTAQASGTFNFIMTILFLFAPVVALIARPLMAKRPARKADALPAADSV